MLSQKQKEQVEPMVKALPAIFIVLALVVAVLFLLIY